MALFGQQLFADCERKRPKSAEYQHSQIAVGGLRFRSSKGLEVSMGGGIDVMRYQGVSSTGSIDAGISYDSSATTIGLVYHRGFSSIVGVGGVVQGDGVAASLSQWLGPRINVNMAAQYTRGSSP